MLMKEELHPRDYSKGKQKKDLLPINLQLLEKKKQFESSNTKKKVSSYKVIIKEEYSDANTISNGGYYNNQNIKQLSNTNQFPSRSNFLANSIQRKEKENLFHSQTNPVNKSDNNKKILFNENENKMFRSVSPNKTDLVNDKSYSPIKEKLKVSSTSKNKLSPQPLQNSHRLTLGGGIGNLIQNIGGGSGGSNNNHMAEAYNSKTKSFNLNILKSNGSHTNLTTTNNYLTLEKDGKKLPDVNVNYRSNNYSSKSKLDEKNYLSNENLKKDISRGFHRPSNSVNFTNTNYHSFNYKKDSPNAITEDLKEKTKTKRDLTPNNTNKLLLKESSEKNIFGYTNGNGFNIHKSGNSKSNNHQRQTSKDMNSGYSSNNNKNENGDSQVKPHNVKKSPFIEKFSCKSKAGVALDGNFKTNQDSYLAKTKIFNLDNYSAFGVFDGHGMHGHFVSNMIKLFLADYYSKLDLFLSKERINTVNMTTTKRLTNINRNNLNTSAGLKEDQIYEKLKEKNCQIIKNSFYQAETTLSQSKYEVNFSGATCVIVLFVDDKIICANAGDSRAILVVGESTGDKIIPLSRDHKPEIKEESNRINKSGGRVERYTENGIKSGPFRVWLKNENFPGLAMSRSVGDFVAESVGVICEPEIFEYSITGNYCKYIVIASDGVWEFLTNERVSEIVNFYYKINDANGAAEKLVEESIKKWKQEDDVVDDITALVIFFNK